jgi:cell division septum initiation protein DivIVA
MANGVIEAINQMIKAINKIPGLDIDLIDTLDLEEFKKEVKDTTDGVDNLTKSINAIPKKTTITIERSAAPGRIEPKKPGQIPTNLSLPTELEGIADIKPDGLESLEGAFFDFADEYKRKIQDTFAEISKLVGGVSNLFSQLHNKRMVELDNEKAKELDKIAASKMSEEEKEKAINDINEKFDNKKAEADKKQAKRAKAVALLEATVATASAVVEALPNIPLSIAAGVIGAAQIATIASTQIPAFAQGGMVTGATLGLVGEGPGTSMSNPEVIAPLDKLKSMIGEGQGSVEVFGRISGSDILISSDRARKNRDRTRGY